MTSSILPLLLPAVVVAIGLAVFLPVPINLTGRFLQHLLSPAVQILAASSAAILLRQAAAGYGPRDRERRVWRLGALAAGLWVIGLLVYAIREWSGQARSYPSAADGFLVGAFLVLLLALAEEFRLVNSILTRGQRLLLAGGALALWVVVVVRFIWPMATSPLDPVEKSLDLFYASTVALLFPLALGPAMAFRGGSSGYVWLGVAGGVLCLALSGLGFAYLTSFEVYSDVHPINLLRVAGLAALGASGAWHRRMLETA